MQEQDEAAAACCYCTFLYTFIHSYEIQQHQSPIPNRLTNREAHES